MSRHDKPHIAEELKTIADMVRHAVSRFNEADLFYGHGTGNALDEAIFIVMECLHLPPDTRLEPFWNCRLTKEERHRVGELIEQRVETRKPAPYLLKRAYVQGIPFYVDERVIVPRSFIGEILTRESGFDLAGDPDDVETVLDLCTGSGCLAILAALIFENAQVDAVDLSADALEVAQRNVADHGLGAAIALFEGNLWEPLGERTYDVILSNPPYVDREGMDALPAEYRHEPEMALASGDDGLDAVREILAKASRHLNTGGGLLCEIGRGRALIEECWPRVPFLWLETENSEGEVFWITREQLISAGL
ncbi:MAG: 50S ribosomal protein L3 N(5)-glutamine methyltransferase [Alphaproteobacteria bacterium]|nr:50S ribosomal protein L3 N(5)-glutamine methyltransferase [Alphaproteobacteria bacterium]